MNYPQGTTHVRKLIEFGEGFEYWMQEKLGWKVYHTHRCEWEHAVPKSWAMPWSVGEYNNGGLK